MNVSRVDIGPFTFFVLVFRSCGHIYHHAHEDCLSYVLYAGTTEVLIDPGRPSYDKSSIPFTAADRHNGLAARGAELRPRPRFFCSRTLMSEPGILVVQAAPGGGAVFSAKNALLQIEKEVSIKPVGPRAATVSEKIRSIKRLREFGFTHCFPSASVPEASRDKVLMHGVGTEISYTVPGVAATLTVSDSARSCSFGQTVPCRRLSIALPDGESSEILWTVTASDS